MKRKKITWASKDKSLNNTVKINLPILHTYVIISVRVDEKVADLNIPRR